MAEDVTQNVFVALAQSAAPLAGRPTVAGWLHRTATNQAANAVRAEVRRRKREQESLAMPEPELAPEWERLEPILDEAMGELRDPDRDAILLRYFRGQSAREMGATLGISEATAQKRVNRAVDRLRERLALRGVPVGAGLVAAITAHAVQPAPTHLIPVVTAASLATTPLTTVSFIAMTTFQKTLAGGAILLGIGTGFLLNSSIREEPVSTATPPLEVVRESAQPETSLGDPAPPPPELPPTRPAAMPQPVVASVPPVATADPPAPLPPTALQIPATEWTDVGLETPEDTLRTRGWTILHGNRERFRDTTYITDGARRTLEDLFVRMAEASTDPDKAAFIQAILDEGFGVEEGLLMPMMAEHRDRTYTGYQVQSSESPSPETQVLNLEVHTEGAAPRKETVTFLKTDQGWKVLIDEAFLQRMMPPGGLPPGSR